MKRSTVKRSLQRGTPAYEVLYRERAGTWPRIPCSSHPATRTFVERSYGFSRHKYRKIAMYIYVVVLEEYIDCYSSIVVMCVCVRSCVRLHATKDIYAAYEYQMKSFSCSVM